MWIIILISFKGWKVRIGRKANSENSSNLRRKFATYGMKEMPLHLKQIIYTIIISIVVGVCGTAFIRGYGVHYVRNILVRKRKKGGERERLRKGREKMDKIKRDVKQGKEREGRTSEY